ncbi:MAG: RlmE family RNA methyltransferase [Treponema sp.]|jgi:23S rRNA (uridine2552-2'-O)-methyltransferase|nr:RlmE family RNA methyltransferase [Treponema sp.]
MNYQKPDYWADRARKEAYPARSVYKLKEIEEKFCLFKPASPSGALRILDLGAAPGSWSLYSLRKLRSRCMLTAADINALSRQYDAGLFDGGNFRFIQGDITQTEIREAILSQGPFGLIMSDAAPSTTGNRRVDTCRSLELAEAVLSYAESGLERGGNLVLKVFQGGETGPFLKRIRSIFSAGKSFKPEACRSTSFETYIIGLGKQR